ncbi:hypothetical protein D3C77_478380 [compost metagenome]
MYIALLRGINVGGHNKIKMAELRQALLDIGFTNVKTYIQSGNILFHAQADKDTICKQIEEVLLQRWGLNIKVMIRTADEIRAIIATCPFTLEQITAAEASAGGEALYVSMIMNQPNPAKLTKLEQASSEQEQYVLVRDEVYMLLADGMRNSKLAVAVDKLGVPVTTRNWKTMTKLCALLDENIE